VLASPLLAAIQKLSHTLTAADTCGGATDAGLLGLCDSTSKSSMSGGIHRFISDGNGRFSANTVALRATTPRRSLAWLTAAGLALVILLVWFFREGEPQPLRVNCGGGEVGKRGKVGFWEGDGPYLVEGRKDQGPKELSVNFPR